MVWSKNARRLLPEFEAKQENKNEHKHKNENENETLIFSFFYKNLQSAKLYAEKTMKNLPIDLQKVPLHGIIRQPKLPSLQLQNLPKPLQIHITRWIRWEVSVATLPVFDRDVTIYFFTETKPVYAHMEAYLTRIFMWLYILSHFAPRKCSHSLVLYFYMTSMEKTIPRDAREEINVEHVNTAFTFSCKFENEIVLFRKEEWFKVFLHETMHAFGLDFSGMNCEECNAFIQRQMFQVPSEINLYEAYTEYWAELWNIGFCAFFHTVTTVSKDKEKIKSKGNGKDKTAFLSLARQYLQTERNFSCFQLVKCLRFMRLRYDDLCNHHVTKKNTYKEKTNVLSYYIIKTILISHANSNAFLEWCFVHNGRDTPFVFQTTKRTLMAFCRFLQSRYRDPDLLACISDSEKQLQGTNDSFLWHTMRMTTCEME
jgi:hypothetical protein